MRNGIILGCLLGLLAMALFSTQVLGQESAACPNCKEMTQVTKKGGGVHLEKKMVCPECKGEGTALDPHVCNKCGQELLLCSQCKKVVAHAAPSPAAQVRCPTCKETVTATKKGGGVRLEKAMQCPSCKETVEELGAFECEKCGKELIACVICRQYSGFISEEPPVEARCPNCKEMVTTTKKGGGVSLEKKMICPNCQKEVQDMDVHTCSKCGADMLLCPLCKKPM
jgi:phage FluMu protein Com